MIEELEHQNNPLFPRSIPGKQHVKIMRALRAAHQRLARGKYSEADLTRAKKIAYDWTRPVAERLRQLNEIQTRPRNEK